MDKYLQYILKVQSIAKIGLKYSKDPYAIENYNELEVLSKQMLEEFTSLKFERPNYFEKDIYPTPNVSVRALIYKEDKIAFVKEKRDGKYSLPGGWADIFESPKEAILKECTEELGAKVKLNNVIAVIDRSKYRKQSKIPDYVIVFDGEHIEKVEEPCHEILSVEFYDENNLPTDLSFSLTPSEIKDFIKASKEKKVLFN